jgi:hypothetical protein
VTSTLFLHNQDITEVYEATCLPSLEHSAEFQHWALEQNRAGNLNNAIHQLLILEQGDHLATFRAACLGQWFVKPNVYRELMWQSFSATSPAVSAQAQSFLVLLDFVQNRNNGLYCMTLLEDLVYRLDLLPLDSLIGEAKAAVLTNLGLIKSASHANTESKRLATQAIFLSRHFGLPISEMRAQNLLIQSNLLGGSVAEALSLIHESLKQGVEDQHAATYQHTSYAAGLAHLGGIEQAVEWLSRESLNPINELAVTSLRQWFTCLGGIDDLETPVEEQYQPNANVRWLVYTLRELLRLRRLPRTNRFMEQAQDHLKNALAEACRGEVFTSNWYLLLNRWLISLIQQRQGKSILSVQSLAGLPAPAREWLDVRVLLAGLRLEQALDLNLPFVEIEPAEQELLEVFRDAENILMASPAGLADLLAFWHPLAAAYLALTAPNQPYLKNATDPILRLGSKNTAAGVSISPALAGELLLRSVGLDLIEGQPLTQVKLGAGERGNFREEILRISRGPNTYYHSPISAIQLAYGLKKHPKNSLQSQLAWPIVKQYGMVPKSPLNTAPSELQMRVGTLEVLAVDLLNDQISPGEFAKSVLSLV